MPKHITTGYLHSLEFSRQGPSSARLICLDSENPWDSRPRDIMLAEPHGPATAAILYLPEGEKEVVVAGRQIYSWGAPFEVLTYEAYAGGGENGARRSVRRETVPSLSVEYREKYASELEDQFQELRYITLLGEWPQPHSLNFRREELAAAYVIYSGGETSFSPAGYRRAGYRGWGPAHGFLRKIAEGQVQPARAIKPKLVDKAANPPWPEKRGELWMVEKARRALGLKAKPADNASWTDLRWRVIELAVELGWKPWDRASKDDELVA